MLSVQIICIGKLKEKFWLDACREYGKRLMPFCRFSILELPETRLPDQPSPAQIESALEEEGKKILSAASNSILVPLCIEGELLSSPELADQIHSWSIAGGSSISFVIGSSFGLAESIKKKGKIRLSMSPMTFPHQLARVMLCEQVYRAFQILHHGKYHK